MTNNQSKMQKERTIFIVKSEEDKLDITNHNLITQKGVKLAIKNDILGALIENVDDAVFQAIEQVTSSEWFQEQPLNERKEKDIKSVSMTMPKDVFGDDITEEIWDLIVEFVEDLMGAIVAGNKRTIMALGLRDLSYPSVHIEASGRHVSIGACMKDLSFVFFITTRKEYKRFTGNVAERICASNDCDFKTYKNEIMKCSACKVVRYCNEKCQKEHWANHKEKCKRYSRIRKQQKVATDEFNAKIANDYFDEID